MHCVGLNETLETLLSGTGGQEVGSSNLLSPTIYVKVTMGDMIVHECSLSTG